MKSWRRYEILLPLRFNDGTPIPKVLLAQTVQELEDRFGAVSCEMQVIEGRWQSGGVAYRDELMRAWVDAESTPEIRAFFEALKTRAKERFRQIDIWVTSHSIQVL